MRKFLTALGLAFTMVNSLYASGSSHQNSPAPCSFTSDKSAKGPYAEPRDQDLALSPFARTCDAYTWLLSIDYVGGYLEADGTDFGIAGAGARSTSVPSQGTPLAVDLDWGSGVHVALAVSDNFNDGRNLYLAYMYFTSSNDFKTYSQSGYPTVGSITPSLPTDYTSGARDTAYQVSGRYETSYLQRGTVAYARSLVSNGGFSLLGHVGVDIFFVSQKLSSHIFTYDGGPGAITSYYLSERMGGAGPQIGLLMNQLFCCHCGIKGALNFSAPVMGHSLSQSDQYIAEGSAPTYGLNTHGSVTTLNQIIDSEITLFYKYITEESGVYEFRIGWATTFAPNISLLTNMPGTVIGSGQALSLSALTVGLSCAY